MEDKAKQISDRLLGFGVELIHICMRLNNTNAGRHIGLQLLRAGTSAGANYEEACGARSRADFINKVHIAFKEIRESIYWLKLIQRSNILHGIKIEHILNEARQVSAILGKSLKTAKGKK
jgi:four helix bundle protein